MSKPRYKKSSIRENIITMRLNDFENESLIYLMEKKGLSKSEYIRKLINDAYDKEVYNNGL